MDRISQVYDVQNLVSALQVMVDSGHGDMLVTKDNFRIITVSSAVPNAERFWYLQILKPNGDEFLRIPLSED